MTLTVKQWRAGAVNAYEVKLTVHVHHQSEKEAKSYLMTALQDWAADGKIIASVQFDSVQESDKRFFAPGVMYPENVPVASKMEEEINIPERVSSI
jgi:hypothetical protein